MSASIRSLRTWPVTVVSSTCSSTLSLTRSTGSARVSTTGRSS
ncbi:hypothetical protein ACFQ60_44065 [Streptomyces zhihengii]